MCEDDLTFGLGTYLSKNDEYLSSQLVLLLFRIFALEEELLLDGPRTFVAILCRRLLQESVRSWVTLVVDALEYLFLLADCCRDVEMSSRGEKMNILVRDSRSRLNFSRITGKTEESCRR